MSVEGALRILIGGIRPLAVGKGVIPTEDPQAAAKEIVRVVGPSRAKTLLTLLKAMRLEATIANSAATEQDLHKLRGG